jgi:recombination protein RecA
VSSPASLFRDALAKKLKGVARVSLMGEGTFAAEPKEFLPTPFTLLNAGLGGGLAYGRVAEIYGPEQTGKSQIVLSALGENQRRGGLSGYIDTEYASSKAFAKGMTSVNVDELLHFEVDSLEGILKTTIDFVEQAPEGVPLALGIDSVAGKDAEQVKEVEFGKNAKLGVTPMMIRTFFKRGAELIAGRSVCVMATNHETANIGARPWEEKYNTTGGSAIKYWTSTRIRLQRVSMLKQGDQVIGTKNRATIVKNRNDPPFRKIEFYTLFYGPHKGFDDALTTFMYLKEKGFFLQAAGWIRLDEGGEKYRRDDLLTALRTPDSPLGQRLKNEATTIFQNSWGADELEAGVPTNPLGEE